MPGILRIIPIERMNALLVITPQPAYLDEVKKWIERLDKSGDGDGPQLLSSTTCRTSVPRSSDRCCSRHSPAACPQAAAPSAPTLAPGTPAGSIVNPPTFQQQSGVIQPTITVNTQPAPGTQHQGQGPGTTAAGRAGEGLGIVRNIQVVADKDNNTLLIVATPPEYSVIEAALKKLDVPPRQVVIEVTIASMSR